MFQMMVDWVSSSNWSYVAIFAVAVLDAFFPVVPSETMVIVAGTLAGAGDLNVFLVILAAWGGAVTGDNISYGIGKVVGERTVKRLFRHEKAHRGFDWAEQQLEERGSYIIIVARFIPFGRTAVTFTSGYTRGLPWHRFFRYDLVAGGVWATYATMLGYVGGQAVRGAAVEGRPARVGDCVRRGVLRRMGEASAIEARRRAAAGAVASLRTGA